MAGKYLNAEPFAILQMAGIKLDGLFFGDFPHQVLKLPGPLEVR